MDLWVVAAAAGAGYLAKYWKNFSNEREGLSLSLSGESETRNLLQQIQKRNGLFWRLKQKQLGIDDILGGENSGETSDLALEVASSSDFGGAGCDDCRGLPAICQSPVLNRRENKEMGAGITGKAEFSGDSYNITDVILTQKTPHRAFKSMSHGSSTKPLDSLESCVAAQLHREHEVTNDYEFSSLPSPYAPSVRTLLVTDGSQLITRVGGVSFRAESRFEGGGKKLHKEDGINLEENETLLGIPSLPRELNQNVGKGRVLRLSSRGITASSESSNSQGSSHRMLLFFLGFAIGIMATLVATWREVHKLNGLLKQTENLVQDLHEELEMKDFLTVQEVTNEGFESMKDHDESFPGGKPTAISLEKEFNQSTKFNVEELDNENKENSELMSKIEAELEAELEMLEENMKASSNMEKLSDFVGLDTHFITQVIQGEVKGETLKRQPDAQSNSDHDVCGSSTHHSVHYAVSPRELSLRLHEVIQSRLEARIIELEAALQKRSHSMQQECIISMRELYSEVGSLSTQQSPISVDEGSSHPMVTNLSGEAPEAYSEAYEEISKMPRTGEEVPPKTAHNTDLFKTDMQPFDGELSLSGNGGNDGSIKHQSIVGEGWSRTLVRDRIRSWEERTSRSWGSNEFVESEEDEEDEMGKLLIKQILGMGRQGSAAVLNAQRMLYLRDDQ